MGNKSAELDEIQTLQKTISNLEARLASLVFEKKKSNIEYVTHFDVHNQSEMSF